MKKSLLSGKAVELLEAGAVIITGIDIKDGIMERAQVYFASENEAVMDIINKDDLVQNFPDEGVYVLTTSSDGKNGEFRKLEMFEGEEDMYFRTDGTHEEVDEFSNVPTVTFMETVEQFASFKLKN
ncbi:MAG: hypothetical protein IKA71_02690 [Lentisphaeria bacterium]|nr:hypothetical protein [Lentisphaeria bacterium]